MTSIFIDAATSRARPGSSASHLARAARTRELFGLVESSESEDERRDLRAQVIEMYLGMAHQLAARYRLRSVSLDDLEQVAALALVKAAHGYDVTKGHDFLTYAVPTIRGELRKHFRDRGWMIRPPRRIQELQAEISKVTSELTFSLGRSPRADDLARRLGADLESVLEALQCNGCFTPASLDLPVGRNSSLPLSDLLAGEDPERGAAEARMVLGPVLEKLPDRDRQILHLRFVECLTQAEIGDRLGVSQMQVSRLLTRILGRLSTLVGDVAA